MAEIGQLVRDFLKSLNIKSRKIARYSLKWDVDGRNGQWESLATWDKERTVLVLYNLLPVVVPQKQRIDMCQYLCKLNTDLTWGNFQMDYDDGWVALRTSFPLKALRLSRRVIASLVLTGFRTMDDHVQGLLTVASGQATVKKKRRRLAQHASARRSRPCDGNTQPVSKDYRALRQHRVEQFAEYLRRMGKRAHEEVGGACFMIFETPIEGAENVRGESLSDRTVQFVFEQNWFAVDLPNTSLLPGEAERIVRSRPGFYREAETPEANVSQTQDVVEYDPIGKKYTYGDEQEASEDAAWLLYDALNLSLNAEIRVRAADFEGEHEYEDGELLP